MTATNPLWAEETGLHAPGTQKKGGNREGAGNTAVTVLKMMMTRPWTSTYMALGFPLLTGLILLCAGLVTLLVTDYGATNLINFYRFHSIHSVLVPCVFGAVMFMSFRQSARLITGMGVSQWSFFNGLVLTSVYNAALATCIYTVFALVENLTFGYGVGWHVIGTGIKESSMVFPDQYSLTSTIIDYVNFAEYKFLTLLAAQIFAIFLSALSLRFSIFASVLGLVLLPIYFIVVLRTPLAAMRKDLGLWYLLQPYWVDENGERHFYSADYDHLVGGYYEPDGTEVVQVVESTLDLGSHFLNVYGISALLALLLAALVWRGTSLR